MNVKSFNYSKNSTMYQLLQEVKALELKASEVFERILATEEDQSELEAEHANLMEDIDILYSELDYLASESYQGAKEDYFSNKAKV